MIKAQRNFVFEIEILNGDKIKKKNYLEKNLKTKIPKNQKFIFLSNQKFKMSQKSKTKTVEKF